MLSELEKVKFEDFYDKAELDLFDHNNKLLGETGKGSLLSL